MNRQVARGVVPVLVVPFLIFGSGIAPLHAHESGPSASSAIVHGHVEPHRPAAHDDHHGEAELDHAERIVWLDLAVSHARTFQLDAPAGVLTPIPGLVTCPRQWSAVVFDDAAPPHGPPLDAASLRAPPARPA